MGERNFGENSARSAPVWRVELGREGACLWDTSPGAALQSSCLVLWGLAFQYSGCLQPVLLGKSGVPANLGAPGGGTARPGLARVSGWETPRWVLARHVG